ncbi:MAG: hypothetical protein JNL94_02065 [Planctomycetes bacterium]|nr:hypothetical protein [Planctomycetota bacterium]
MFRPVGSVLLVALSACAVTPTPEVPRLGELPEPAWIFDGERRAESACVIGSDVVIVF